MFLQYGSLRAGVSLVLVRLYYNNLFICSIDPTVRDAAAEALGTATRLVGEKNIAPHIGKLEPLKEQKIKEFADKVSNSS